MPQDNKIVLGAMTVKILRDKFPTYEQMYAYLESQGFI